MKAAASACDSPMGKPLGVWAVIALRSSPLASPIGYAAMAIAAGNTVVLMPSGACPRPVFSVFDIFRSAGLPDGVLNIVCDRIDRFIPELCDTLEVMGTVASGCGPSMDELMFLAVDDDMHFVNEVKGMNPVVVSAPSDMKKAASAILESAAVNAGTGLFACSKVFVKAEEHRAVWLAEAMKAEEERALLSALIEKLKDFKVGDPTYAGTAMGPLMNDKVEAAFKELRDSHLDCVAYGGKKVPCDSNGRYYSPLLLVGLADDDEILYADSGLPVIAVRAYTTVDSLKEELSQTDCGLSVGVMSTDSKVISAVKKFAEEDGLIVWGNEGSRGLKAAARAKVRDFCKN